MFPTLARYNQVIQKPNEQIFATLRGFDFLPSRTIPFKIYTHGSGSYAVVFKAKHLNREYAIRCFISAETENISRYKSISKYLANLEASWLVTTELLENEINVDHAYYPLIKMEWVNGVLLNSYIDGILDSSEQLSYLQDQIIRISHSLEDNLVGHGDIQCGNIIVVKERSGHPILKLIDYDGMYVPALSSKQNLERGRSEFQHPTRNSSLYSEKMDRFSFWVILTSLEALKFDRTLWQQVMQGGYNTLDNLLFTGEDFKEVKSSKLFIRLYALNKPSLNYYLDALVSFCKKDSSETSKVVGFHKQGPGVSTLNGIRTEYLRPQVLKFGSHKNKIKQGDPLTIEWEVNDAKSLKLDTGNQVIDVPLIGSRTLFPVESKKYKLIILSFNDGQREVSTEEIVVVKPVEILYFRSSRNEVFKNKPFTLEWDVQNATGLHLVPDERDVSGMSQISASTDKSITYILKAINDFYEETSSLQINIMSEARLIHFELSKSVIAFDESTELSWEVENCRAVELHLKSGILYFPPKSSTRLTASSVGINMLKAVGLDGSEITLKEINIDVCRPVKINHFRATVPKILTHSSTILSWDTENATDIIISPIGLDGSERGHHSVFPNVTTLYELTAKNALFSKTISCTIEVVELPIIEFSTSKNQLENGVIFEVVWEIQHALSARLLYDEEAFDIPFKGFKSVTLLASKTCTIAVTALDGFTIVEEFLQLDVALPVVIRSFKPLIDTLPKGGSTQLEWEVENATEITILPVNYNVTGLRSLKVSPLRGETYILTARNDFFTASEVCKVSVKSSPMLNPKFIIGALVLIILGAFGWLWSDNIKQKKAILKVESLVSEGEREANSGRYENAIKLFKEARALNEKLSQSPKSKLLSEKSQYFYKDAEKRCTAYGSNFPELYYIANYKFQLSAALNGETHPKTCP